MASQRSVWALAALATCLTASAARSAWSPDGNRVSSAAGDAYEAKAIPFGSGGALIAWVDETPNPPDGLSGVYVQALDVQGRIAAGWPATGLQVSDMEGYRRNIALTADGFGGAFVSWQEASSSTNALFLQHVIATGAVFAGWPADGRRVAETVALPSQALAADGEGGVFVAWSGPLEPPSSPGHRLLRLDAGGAPASGWPADGILLGTPAVFAGLALEPDGAGGVFAAWPERWSYEQGARLLVHRFRGDGTPHPAWQPVGAVLGEGQWNVSLPILVPDRSGGVYASWLMSPGICPLADQPAFCPDCDCPTHQAVTHLNGQGNPIEGWSTAGRSIGAWGKISLDDTGGLLASTNVTFRSTPPLYRWLSRGVVTRLRADGTLAPGWVEGGNPVCSEYGWQQPEVVADGRGGAFTSWIDNRIGAPVLYVSRLTSSGALDAGWPETGSIAAPAALWPGPIQLVRSGPEEAIVVWIDRRTGGANVYADQVTPGPAGPPAPLDVVADANAGFGIARTWPNPARAAFSAVVAIPEGAPATLELVDVSGRVVESRRFHFEGPARGSVRLNEGARLEPGIYWIRLRQGLRMTATRITVLR